jgi:hypothetical protein
MNAEYTLRTEYSAGFGWQFSVYKCGELRIRRGSYETEQQAREAGLRLMAHHNAPTQFEFTSGEAHA